MSGPRLPDSPNHGFSPEPLKPRPGDEEPAFRGSGPGGLSQGAAQGLLHMMAAADLGEEAPPAVWKSLNDAAGALGIPELMPGSTQVLFARKEAMRELLFYGTDLCTLKVDPSNLGATHIVLGSVAGKVTGPLVCALQGETWSPKGEARNLIRSQGLGHTSFSQGDGFVIDGKVLISDGMNFLDAGTVPPAPPEEAPATVLEAPESKYQVDRTFEVVTPESGEQGGTADRGFVYEGQVMERSDLVKELRECVHLSDSAVAPGTWATTERNEDRAFFERGEDRTESIHIKAEDGSYLDGQEMESLFVEAQIIPVPIKRTLNMGVLPLEHAEAAEEGAIGHVKNRPGIYAAYAIKSEQYSSRTLMIGCAQGYSTRSLNDREAASLNLL